MDTKLDESLSQLAEVLSPYLAEKAGYDADILREELALAQKQLATFEAENQGWLALNGGVSEDDGPTLTQVRDMSNLLRPAVAESPLPKQANALRQSYTFSKPFVVSGLSDEAKRGRPSDLRAFADKPRTREFFLGTEAHELISTACSTTGVYLLLGEDNTKNVRNLPFTQIATVMVNPEFPDEIWAYLREWHETANATEVTRRWYYSDRFEGTRRTEIRYENTDVPVAADRTVIDLQVNRQSGWAWGVPDLWAGHVWNRNYLASVRDGMAVTQLLSWLTAKIKKQSPAGSSSTGVTINKGGKAGSVQTYGEGNAIDTYATTGKAYEFALLNPIAALYALSAGVSVVDLLANPAASGSSYGAANALTSGQRRAIEIRRELIASWMERVFRWATGKSVKVTPESIEEVEPYRRMQMAVLAHTTGMFHADELRSVFADLAGVSLLHPSVPDGYLLPNNEKSLPRKDIDTDSAGNATNTSAPNPSQGVSDGTGGQGSTAANDQRSDTQT